MSSIIKITTTSIVPVGTTEIKLPFYYVSGNHFKHYVCVTEEMQFVSFHSNGRYISMDTTNYDDDDLDLLSNRIKRDMNENLYEPISEAVFMHMFSEAHRNLFYKVNPNLKPIE
jgi:hypothetical protein